MAERLARHLGANTVTGVALASTLGAASLAAGGQHLLALSAWLLGRLLDGLDGAVARRRNEASDYGGYLDMVADTVGYAAVPFGVAFGVDERGAWIALTLLLASFYVNAISWTWLSAVLEKRGAGASATGETTSVTMPAALVEGTETIIFFGLFLALPDLAVWLFTTMAVLVTVNVIQRLAWARRALDVLPDSASPWVGSAASQPGSERRVTRAGPAPRRVVSWGSRRHRLWASRGSRRRSAGERLGS